MVMMNEGSYVALINQKPFPPPFMSVPATLSPRKHAEAVGCVGTMMDTVFLGTGP
jgi:hypothetical protein